MDDVVVDSGTLARCGNGTKVKLAVNEPRTDIPVSGHIVEDALRHSLEEDAVSTISNLQLAVVNETMISETQRDNAVFVRLLSTRIDQASH